MTIVKTVLIPVSIQSNEIKFLRDKESGFIRKELSGEDFGPLKLAENMLYELTSLHPNWTQITLGEVVYNNSILELPYFVMIPADTVVRDSEKYQWVSAMETEEKDRLLLQKVQIAE